MTDLETRLQNTFASVADSEPVPPIPDDVAEAADGFHTSALEQLFPHAVTAAVVRRPKRRRALVAVAALAIVGGGLSVAAAAGWPVLPQSVVQALGWTPIPGAYNADPATARVLLTESGPNGRTLRLWGADANDDGYCVTFSAGVNVDPTAADGYAVEPQNAAAGGVYAASCGDIVGSTYWNTFGGEPTDSSGPTGPYTFIVRVPGAATVRLEFDDGKTRALPIGNGYTAGWLTHAETLRHPVLVGLSGDGAEVGRIAVPLHSR